MTRSMKSVLFLGAVLLVTFALQESPAAACTYQCQQVPGKPLFCRQCVDTGSFTNVTCANSGPCGCYFVPNSCAGRRLPRAAATPSGRGLAAPRHRPRRRSRPPSQPPPPSPQTETLRRPPIHQRARTHGPGRPGLAASLGISCGGRCRSFLSLRLLGSVDGAQAASPVDRAMR
jgi:hypothetical protein